MATAAIELEQDAFMELVTENHLQVEGPTKDHWLYTGKKGRSGWELYKTKSQPAGWLYQARRVNSQTNAGGGALAIRIQLAAGQTAKIIRIRTEGPVTNTANTQYVLDEDGNASGFFGTLTAASAILNLPSVGTDAAGANNRNFTAGMILGPGEFFRVQAAAAANTETLTLHVVLLLSTSDIPTWDTTGSAGTPSLAASTISAANTLQAVYL